MSASLAATKRPRIDAPTRSALGADEDNPLGVFPSEADGRLATYRAPGVRMRVAPISPSVALGLVAVLLLGLTSAAAIGLLAAGPSGLR